jgi:hypothetical protein
MCDDGTHDNLVGRCEIQTASVQIYQKRRTDRSCANFADDNQYTVCYDMKWSANNRNPFAMVTLSCYRTFQLQLRSSGMIRERESLLGLSCDFRWEHPQNRNDFWFATRANNNDGECISTNYKYA